MACKPGPQAAGTVGASGVDDPALLQQGWFMAAQPDLHDFVQVKANGKIAMKLGDDDRLIGVATCDETDDILLASWAAKCIRFKSTDVRVFQGRSSTGVRGG